MVTGTWQWLSTFCWRNGQGDSWSGGGDRNGNRQQKRWKMLRRRHAEMLWKERGREREPGGSRVGGGRAVGGSDNSTESWRQVECGWKWPSRQRAGEREYMYVFTSSPSTNYKERDIYAFWGILLYSELWENLVAPPLFPTLPWVRSIS